MSKTKQLHDDIEICGAKTRAGTPCQQKAGWGTNHVGEGRCKLHGGKSTGAPKKNDNAKKHGLYAKYFPEDTLELFDALETESPIEMLWNNIKIQYSAIILAQRKMRTKIENDIECESKDGLILLKKTQKGLSERATTQEKSVKEITQDYESASLEFQRYVDAQSRAMSTLNNMIKNYTELCRSELATEEQRLRIEKLKAEIDNLNKYEASSQENKVADLMEGILDEVNKKTETSI